MLDQVFDPTGNLIVNTPIEYRKRSSIPEPCTTLGLLAVGVWGLRKKQFRSRE